MNNLSIHLIDPQFAKDVCKSITSTLPEWFGIAEANERYEEGMLSRTSFAACLGEEYIGMITLEFPYPNNANIYWMGVKKNYHRQQVGKKLLHTAENYCIKRGCTSLTVETLSDKQQDENYLKTYAFYQQAGFKPLFEMYTYDPHNLMTYMQKVLGLGEFNYVDLSHTLSSEIPHWGNECGFKNKIDLDYSQCTTDVKFCVQSFESVAGIGTHIDAPAHCISEASTVSDISLESLIVPCRMIDVSDKAFESYCVTTDDILKFENEFGVIPSKSFVIIYTGWSQWWAQPKKYRNGLVFPSISKSAAELLISRNIAGLGIDTLSPDTGNSGFPVHAVTLGAGKYLIENVANASRLNAIGDYVIGLPMKIHGGTEAPMRLIALQRK